MYKTRSIVDSRCFSCGLVCLGLMLAGCEKVEQITAYTVPKHDSLQTSAYLEQTASRQPKPRRMLGVIIPHESLFWFFKLEGGVDEVAARESDVRDFLKSLSFPSPESLEWTLPTGWQRLPGSELRYATLVLAVQPALEMSVTKLPLQRDLPIEEQVLANLNRWRGQLMLPSVAKTDLDRQTEKLELPGINAYWVNLVGRAKARPAGMTLPPAQSAPKAAPAAEQAPPAAQNTVSPPGFDKPEEWTVAPPAMFALVSLQATEGDAKVAITVTPARGDRLNNVNRWRGQVKLEPFTAEGLAAAGKKVDVGSNTGDLYEISNGERTILGVIVDAGSQMWFIKLDGVASLAEREKPRFEAFLKSLRWE